jgi:rhodanese-related sulfurtransferase
MSPNSAGRAEKLGYTNVKVYHDGLPEWIKKNYVVLSSQSLNEAYINKDIPIVLLDVRPVEKTRTGFIKGAVTLPAASVAANIGQFPPKDKKPPIIVVDDKGGADAINSAKAVVAAGYASVAVLTGGMDAWNAAKFPVETGNPAATIVYIPKPRAGEISVEDFLKIARNTPADTLILDVRDPDEANFGMIKGAKLVPDSALLDRLAEIPRDKKIIAYCTTGSRAEMTYHKLKEKGYNVKFLYANVEFDDKGDYRIYKP